MTIQNACRLGGTIFLVALILVGWVATTQFERLRFGGEVHTQNQQLSDLIADILPPPAYIIEPYLVATKALTEPELVEEHASRLEALKATYEERKTYWAESNLANSLKTSLLNKASVKADAFWTEVDAGFLPALRAGDQEAAQRSYLALEKLYQAHRDEIDSLVTATGLAQKELTAQTNDSLTSTMSVVSALGLAMVIVCILGLHLLGSRVVKPMRKLADAMTRMGEGDLDLSIPGYRRKDEIGGIARALATITQHVEERATADALRQARENDLIVTALGQGLGALKAGDLSFRISTPFPDEFEVLRATYNGTMEALSSLIADVARSAESVRSGASEIAAAARDLSDRTETQSSSLAETNVSVGKITTSVASAADTAVAANSSAQATRSEAEASGIVMREALEAMEAVSRTSEQMKSIIGIIDGIAFQTNLLALNAGVEAARAGDAGNGFAVVANEVRALAQRSAEAASQISSLIADSAKEVTTGVATVRQVHGSLEQIVGHATHVSELIATLADGGQTQSAAIHQVGSSVDSLDRITRQNAALAEEASTAATGLSQESSILMGLVGRFRVQAQQRSRATHSATALHQAA